MFPNNVNVSVLVSFVIILSLFLLAVKFGRTSPEQAVPATPPNSNPDPDRFSECLDRVEKHMKYMRFRRPEMSARTIQRHLYRSGFSISRDEVKSALMKLVTNHHTVVVKRSRRGRLLFAAR